MTPDASGAGASSTAADATVAGFERQGRRPGVRNHVLVLPSVICSGDVAEAVAESVPAATCAPHDHGCGQIGADKDQTRRTLVNLAANPNVAGAVLVGLGCETLNSEELAADVAVPVRQTAIQTAGGTDEAIAAGRDAATELAAEAARGGRTERPLADLTLGVTVSDLADSTVDRVHPQVGTLVRTVLDAGGRVVVGGLDALVPHADAAVDLVADDAVAASLREFLEDRVGAASPSRVRRAAVDRPVDDVASLWDGAPVVDVLDYGERATHDRGVALLAADGGFETTATALAAAGTQVVVHGTADGIPTGHPVVPVCKVTGDPETAAALADDVDVDAGSAAPDALREAVLATARGEPTAAEEHGLEAFAVSRSGPSL